MAIGRFIAGIGALIYDPEDDKYLLLRRSSEKDFAPGAWECVTGRVDQGESFEGALHREVREEIGIEVHPLFLIGTTHFFRGEPRPENELVGLVYCCSIENKRNNKKEIQLSAEHAEYRWLTAGQARLILNASNPTERWLRRVIERAEVTMECLPPDLIKLHRRQGFELDN
jgi:8-oxo-dGTP pyrophosphatase MutT (NUDIX family)